MKGIGNAIQEAMQEVQEEMKGNPMGRYPKTHLKASEEVTKEQKNPLQVSLTALKEAVEDS